MEKFKKKIFCMRGKKKNNMEIFMQIITNKYIYVPFFTWVFIQCFKVVWDLITTKKLNFKRIMGEEECQVHILQSLWQLLFY